jgi:glutaminase
MLRNFNVLTGDPEPALDLYFSQCSVSVDCRDLCLMAATLANHGINPSTGERALQSEFVEDVLSVMTTCGMYDYAGEWVYSVGMPAKSGVAGGVMVVLPGQLGIGVFSPRLDARGNSVRGVQVCKDLSRDLQLHFLRVGRSSHAVRRAQYSVATVRSKRRRPESEASVLRELGDRAVVYELQGDLLLPAVEPVVRAVVDRSDEIDVAVLDLRRVTQIAPPAARMLLDLLRGLQALDKELVLVAGERQSRFLRFFEEENAALLEPARLVRRADLDAALEWCEDRLIERRIGASAAAARVALAEHEFCHGLDRESLRRLDDLLERRQVAAGEYIVRRGDPAEEVYLLMSGEVSVVVPLPDGSPRRLATISAGMMFGELAVIDRAARSADVRADAAVECLVLSAAAFDRLGETHPQIKVALLHNMLRSAHQMVSRLNLEVATLASAG